MSAIKVPVRIEKASPDSYYLMSGEEIIAAKLSDQEANQIALALNLHDELVEALTCRMKEVAGHSLSCNCQHCALLDAATP